MIAISSNRALTALLAGALALSACSFASGDDAASRGESVAGGRRFAVTDFSAVTLAGPDRVIIRQGQGFSVVASGPADVLERLRVSQDGAGITIRRARSMSTSDTGIAVVTVTTPGLREIALAGSGEVRADRLSGDRMEATLAGSGDMNVAAASGDALETGVAGSGQLAIAAIEAGSIEVANAGSGRLTMSGSARRAEVTVAGTGGVDAGDLTVADAEIDVVGSGAVALKATGTADVSVMGSGDVDIVGGARCTISRRGSGRVNCR